MHASAPSAPMIGIFDSGVGGLSVLRALREQLPGPSFHYIADAGHAPYGERDATHVVTRSMRVTDHLVKLGACMVVVACNTATACAIDALRRQHPDLPLVGIEPGVKPAVARSRTRRVAVMATPATLSSERFAALVDRHAGDCRVVRAPCAGLAAAIERGDDGANDVQRLLDLYCPPLREAGVDTVVLGCTHYPFVADEIQRRLGPEVTLLDTASAVARRARDLFGAGCPPHPADEEAARLILQTTGEPQTLARLAERGLGLRQPCVGTLAI